MRSRHFPGRATSESVHVSESYVLASNLVSFRIYFFDISVTVFVDFKCILFKFIESKC
jgi:hypothetical protein